MNVDVKASEDNTGKASFRDVTTVLSKTPYIWTIALALFANNFVVNMGVNTYYVGIPSWRGTVLLFHIVTDWKQ